MKFLKQILDGWESVYNAIRYRFDDYEWWEWDRDFWEQINIGYYENYIFPYDDWYNPTISKERQLRLSQKPQIVKPLDSVSMKRIEKILKTQSPLKDE